MVVWQQDGIEVKSLEASPVRGSDLEPVTGDTNAPD
jgi:hypothetical protein